MARRGGPRVEIVDGDAGTAQIAAFERERRELVRRGIAAGGAIVAASSVPLLLAVRNAFAEEGGDVGVLRRAITLERLTVLAYDALVDRARLDDETARLARRLRGHEQEHADALLGALEALREAPPAEPSGVDDVDAVAKGIGDVRTRADALSFAIELESAAVGAYHDAHRKLTDAKLLQTAATIIGAEGQHLVVLRQAAGRPPAPNALERGTAS